MFRGALFLCVAFRPVPLCACVCGPGQPEFFLLFSRELLLYLLFCFCVRVCVLVACQFRPTTGFGSVFISHPKIEWATDWLFLRTGACLRLS
jgi:hypothetical protein